MPVPQYNRLGFLQGAQVGLDASKAALEARLRREQQAQQAQQFEQNIEEEKRRNLATEALSGEELGERRRQFDVGFGDTRERTGLLSREQEERERQGEFGRGLSERELGLKDFETRNEALARMMALRESERSARAREGLSGRELTEAERRNLMAEELAGKRLGLDERAQAEVERATTEREKLEGRKLTVEETDMLRRDALSRMQLEESTRSAMAREKLGGMAETREQAQLEEAKRAARVLEAYRQQQLGQQESEFGRTFGLQTRAQTETERRNPILEALDRARVNAEVERSRVQNQVDVGGLALRGRAQTEAETEGRFNRGAKTRELNQRDAELQFRRFEANLNNAVRNRELDINQAKYLRDHALALSQQGIDLQKFYFEQGELRPGRQASAAASLASAASQAPWQEEQKEAQRTREAQARLGYGSTAQGMQYKAMLEDWQRKSSANPNFPNTPEGMLYAAKLKEWERQNTFSGQTERDRLNNEAKAQQAAATQAAITQRAMDAARLRGDPRAVQEVKTLGAIIKAGTDPLMGTMTTDAQSAVRRLAEIASGYQTQQAAAPLPGGQTPAQPRHGGVDYSALRTASPQDLEAFLSVARRARDEAAIDAVMDEIFRRDPRAG